MLTLSLGQDLSPVLPPPGSVVLCSMPLTSSTLIAALCSAMSVDLLPQRSPRNSSYLVGRIYLSALHLKELVISVAFGKDYYLTACLGGLRTNLIPAHSVSDLCQLTKPLRLPSLTYLLPQILFAFVGGFPTRGLYRCTEIHAPN